MCALTLSALPCLEMLLEYCARRIRVIIEVFKWIYCNSICVEVISFSNLVFRYLSEGPISDRTYLITQVKEFSCDSPDKRAIAQTNTDSWRDAIIIEAYLYKYMWQTTCPPQEVSWENASAHMKFKFFRKDTKQTSLYLWPQWAFKDWIENTHFPPQWNTLERK